MAKVSFSNSHSSIDDVMTYYIDSEEALNLFFDPNHVSARFIGYSKNELDDELKIRKNTLDMMCCLELLTAIEARFRIDYLIRCQCKKRDTFSKIFRAIHKKKKNQASLIDDILSTWRNAYPQHKKILDDFQKSIDYRNWLAHGRYWTPKKTPHINKFDYLSIHTLAFEILSNLKLIEYK